MKASILLLIPLLLVSGCPGKKNPPPPPAQCSPFSEDKDPAEDHCSRDKADCEATLSRLLTQNHANRCPAPPCAGFSAWVNCSPLGQECELGDGSFGQLFSTAEHLRCR